MDSNRREISKPLIVVSQYSNTVSIHFHFVSCLKKLNKYNIIHRNLKLVEMVKPKQYNFCEQLATLLLVSLLNQRKQYTYVIQLVTVMFWNIGVFGPVGTLFSTSNAEMLKLTLRNH